MSYSVSHAWSAIYQLAAMVVGLLGFPMLPLAAGLEWKRVNPYPTVADLRAIAAGDEVVVAVGNSGAVVTSGDGIDWYPAASGTNLDLYDIVWAGDRFVAVGRGGIVLQSHNGTEWTQHIVPPTTNGSIRSIAYSGEVFLADYATSNGGLYRSTNAIDWERVEGKLFSTSGQVRWVGDEFLYVGEREVYAIKESGSVETIETPGFQPVDVHKVGGEFLISGWKSRKDGGLAPSVATSSDGKTWIYSDLPDGSEAQRMLPLLNSIIAVGSRSLLATTDKTNWVRLVSPVNLDLMEVELRDVVAFNNQAIAVGTTGTIISSLDGRTWVRRNSGTTANLRFVTWCGDRYVAVGEQGMVLWSKDGHKWREHQLRANVSLLSVCWNGEVSVIVGENGLIFVSKDLENWVEVPSGTDRLLNTVAWSGEQFVAAGRAIVTSRDGSTWHVTLPWIEDTVYALTAWKGDLYAIVDNLVIRSRDGAMWGHVVTLEDPVDDIVAGADRLLIVGEQTLVTVDGKSWWFGGGMFSDVAFWTGQHFYLARGEYTLRSTDGIMWERTVDNVLYGASSAVYAGGQVIVVSSNGQIELAQLPHAEAKVPFLTGGTLTRQGFSLHVESVRQDKTHKVEVALPDYQGWKAIGEFVPGGERYDFLDSGAASLSSRIYRIRVE